MSIRMRHTRGHTGNRRSHHALTATRAVTDKESGNLRLPHRVDEATGMYRGKQIFTPKEKTSHQHAKGVNTTEVPHSSASGGKHTHDHANAEVKGSKGLFAKLAAGGRPKARSGMGGQAS